MNPVRVAAAGVTLAVLLLVCGAAEGDQLEEIKKAVRAAAPQAAAIDNAAWKKLATSPTPPAADDLENQSLAVVILNIQIAEEPSEAELAEFKYAEKVPRPAEFARAFQPSRFSLLVTPLHAKYIKEVTATLAGDTVTGEISFEAEGVYAGKVGYTARKGAGGKWTITEFRLPARNTRTTQGADGKWKIGVIEKR